MKLDPEEAAVPGFRLAHFSVASRAPASASGSSAGASPASRVPVLLTESPPVRAWIRMACAGRGQLRFTV
jgi:hypothetical protein